MSLSRRRAGHSPSCNACRNRNSSRTARDRCSRNRSRRSLGTHRTSARCGSYRSRSRAGTRYCRTLSRCRTRCRSSSGYACRSVCAGSRTRCRCVDSRRCCRLRCGTCRHVVCRHTGHIRRLRRIRSTRHCTTRNRCRSLHRSIHGIGCGILCGCKSRSRHTGSGCCTASRCRLCHLAVSTLRCRSRCVFTCRYRRIRLVTNILRSMSDRFFTNGCRCIHLAVHILRYRGLSSFGNRCSRRRIHTLRSRSRRFFTNRRRCIHLAVHILRYRGLSSFGNRCSRRRIHTLRSRSRRFFTNRRRCIHLAVHILRYRSLSSFSGGCSGSFIRTLRSGSGRLFANRCRRILVQRSRCSIHILYGLFIRLRSRSFSGLGNRFFIPSKGAGSLRVLAILVVADSNNQRTGRITVSAVRHVHTRDMPAISKHRCLCGIILGIFLDMVFHRLESVRRIVIRVTVRIHHISQAFLIGHADSSSHRCLLLFVFSCLIQCCASGFSRQSISDTVFEGIVVIVGIEMLIRGHGIAVTSLATLGNLRCRNRELNLVVRIGRNILDLIAKHVDGLLRLPNLVTGRIFTDLAKPKLTHCAVFFHNGLAVGSDLHRVVFLSPVHIEQAFLRIADFELRFLGNAVFLITLDSTSKEFAVLADFNAFDMSIIIEMSGTAQLIFKHLLVGIGVIGISIQSAACHLVRTVVHRFLAKHGISFHLICHAGVIDIPAVLCRGFAAVHEICKAFNRLNTICLTNVFPGIPHVLADTGYMSSDRRNAAEDIADTPKHTGSLTDGVKSCRSGDFQSGNLHHVIETLCDFQKRIGDKSPLDHLGIRSTEKTVVQGSSCNTHDPDIQN